MFVIDKKESKWQQLFLKFDFLNHVVQEYHKDKLVQTFNFVSIYGTVKAFKEDEFILFIFD